MKQAVKTETFLIRQIIFICIVFCIASSVSAAAVRTIFTDIAEEKGEFSCLSPNETELLALINQYRQRHGLPAIPHSRSLSKVARMHAVDLSKNSPEKSIDPRGLPCTLHSWSPYGFWEPVCYTADHYYLTLMYNKPREITKRVYNDLAYENVYWSSVDFIAPRRVMQAWENSAKHRELVLEQNMWARSFWQALGIGVYKNMVTMWVGSMPDPLGPMKACSGSVLPVTPPRSTRSK